MLELGSSEALWCGERTRAYKPLYKSVSVVRHPIPSSCHERLYCASPLQSGTPHLRLCLPEHAVIKDTVKGDLLSDGIQLYPVWPAGKPFKLRYLKSLSEQAYELVHDSQVDGIYCWNRSGIGKSDWALCHGNQKGACILVVERCIQEHWMYSPKKG